MPAGGVAAVGAAPGGSAAGGGSCAKAGIPAAANTSHATIPASERRLLFILLYPGAVGGIRWRRRRPWLRMRWRIACGGLRARFRLCDVIRNDIGQPVDAAEK